MFTGLVEVLGRVEARRRGECRHAVDDRWPGRPWTQTAGNWRKRGRQWLLPDGRRQPRATSSTSRPGPKHWLRTNLGETRAGRSRQPRALAPGRRPPGRPLRSGTYRRHGHASRAPAEGEWEFLAFTLDPAWTRLLVSKGSIAVDGVSLTLVDVWADGFSVMLIPHTLAVTTLGLLRPGDRVNIETDILAKHVAKLLGK